MKSITLQIWLGCNKTIPFGQIEHFLKLLALKKPHLKVQGIQFVKKTVSKSTDSFQSEIEEDYIEGDDGGEYDYEKSYETKRVVLWIYLNTFDTTIKIKKTLKVCLMEQYGCAPPTKCPEEYYKDQIVKLSEHRLILKIYDFFYLDEEGTCNLYTVIEQEYVQQTLLYLLNKERIQKTEELTDFQLQSFQYISKILQCELSSDKSSLEKLRYYVVKGKDGHFRIKLNPLDTQSFKYRVIQAKPTTQQQKDKQDQMVAENEIDEDRSDNSDEMKNENQANDFGKMENENICEDDNASDKNEDNNDNSSDEEDGEEQVELNFETVTIKQKDLVQTILEDYPSILQNHSIQFFEILSKHPNLDDFVVEEHDFSTFILKANYAKREVVIKCEKYQNIIEAEKIHSKQPMLEKMNIFQPLIECELIPLEECSYIIFIEDNICFTRDDVNMRVNLDEMSVQKFSDSPQIQRQLFINFIVWMIESFELFCQAEKDFFNLLLLPIMIECDLTNIKNAKFSFKNPLFHYFALSKEEQERIHKDDLVQNINHIKIILKRVIETNYLLDSEFITYTRHYNGSHRLTEFPILSKALQGLKEIIKLQNEAQGVDLALNSDFEIFLTNSFNFDNLDLQELNSILSSNQVQIIKCPCQYLSMINEFIEKPANIKKVILFSPQDSYGRSKFQEISSTEYNWMLEYNKNLNRQPKTDLKSLSNVKQLYINITFDKTGYISGYPFHELLDLEDIVYIIRFSSMRDLRYLCGQVQKCLSVFQLKKNFKRIKFDLQQIERICEEGFSKDYYQEQQYTSSTNRHNQILNFFEQNLKNGLNPKELTQNLKNDLESHGMQIAVINKTDQNVLSITCTHYDQEQPSKQLAFDLRFNDANKLELVNIDSENNDLLNSQCYPIKNFNAQCRRDLLRYWMRSQFLILNMKRIFNIKEFSRCIHNSYNQFRIMIFEGQTQLREMNLELCYCDEVASLMLENSNYLGLTNYAFPFLNTLNINIQRESHQTPGIIKGLINNIQRNQIINTLAYQSGNYGHDKIYRQNFLKIPRLVILHNRLPHSEDHSM